MSEQYVGIVFCCCCCSPVDIQAVDETEVTVECGSCFQTMTFMLSAERLGVHSIH